MARAEDPAAAVAVEVAQAVGPRAVRCVQLRLPAGARVADACAAAARAWGVPPAELEAGLLAVWGRKADRGQAVRDGDRVEILRSLQVDPKEARRQRYRAQGERGRSPRRPRAAVNADVSGAERNPSR